MARLDAAHLMEMGAQLVQAHVGLRDALAGLLQHHGALRPGLAQLSILRGPPLLQLTHPGQGGLCRHSELREALNQALHCLPPAYTAYRAIKICRCPWRLFITPLE